MNIEQIAFEVADELFLDGIAVGHNPAEFLRRCLKKLAEPDVEQVAHLRFWAAQRYAGYGNIDFDEGFEVTTRMEPGVDGSPAFPVFTETQLIAAQQKAAEACAKLIMDNSHDYGRYEHSETIRNGDWREYL